MQVLQGKRYRHYKGNIYEVIAIARHSETLEEVVVYKGEYIDPEFGENPVWVRPLRMFGEKVTHQGRQIDRFTLLE